MQIVYIGNNNNCYFTSVGERAHSVRRWRRALRRWQACQLARGGTRLLLICFDYPIVQKCFPRPRSFRWFLFSRPSIAPTARPRTASDAVDDTAAADWLSRVLPPTVSVRRHLTLRAQSPCEKPLAKAPRNDKRRAPSLLPGGNP